VPGRCGQLTLPVLGSPAHENLYLDRMGIRIFTGTIVDATIIAAPSSTRNSKKERDKRLARQLIPLWA